MTKRSIRIWIGENESPKFWLGVLNGMKNRGLEDVLIYLVLGSYILHKINIDITNTSFRFNIHNL